MGFAVGRKLRRSVYARDKEACPLAPYSGKECFALTVAMWGLDGTAVHANIACQCSNVAYLARRNRVRAFRSHSVSWTRVRLKAKSVTWCPDWPALESIHHVNDGSKTVHRPSCEVERQQ